MWILLFTGLGTGLVFKNLLRSHVCLPAKAKLYLYCGEWHCFLGHWLYKPVCLHHPPKPTGSLKGWIMLRISVKSPREHDASLDKLNTHRCSVLFFFFFHFLSQLHYFLSVGKMFSQTTAEFKWQLGKVVNKSPGLVHSLSSLSDDNSSAFCSSSVTTVYSRSSSVSGPYHFCLSNLRRAWLICQTLPRKSPRPHLLWYITPKLLGCRAVGFDCFLARLCL